MARLSIPALLVSVLGAVLTGGAIGAEAGWIWSANEASSDNEPRFVRAAFELAGDPSKATLTITADNKHEAFVNGQSVSQSNEWKEVKTVPITNLVKGNNVLAVKAENDGGQAGLIFELAITLKDGSKVQIISDKTARWTGKAQKDWNQLAFSPNGWKGCVEIGAWNMPPWNLESFGEKNVVAGNQDDPEVERASFEVADGFEVSLFATDPLIAKPIQMNWDASGRLWLVSSSIYPQIMPGETANDKVLILEDTDGDGKAEGAKIFAEGLFIPTGVEIGDGGAYVANSTEIIHLKDTDGDGKADTRRTVLSGFGTEDTHHIVHTFRWGPEGNLYFNQSIYIHSHLETPHGTRRLGGGGIWRFRPSSYELEVFCKGMCNPWGHHVDNFGQSFGTDGAGGDGIHFLIPGATYPHFPGGGKILPGLNPGHPKYAGLEIVSGRHLPDDWQGDMITNDFRAHRVVRFKLSEDGSGFSSKLMPDLIKTKNKAFRPIDVKMGPDGAIYIADWYNPIINHGEVDFYDKRRDRTRGRIWRVTAKGRPLVERPKLVQASTKDLLDQLKSPEGWTRHFAKRVLAERDVKEVLPILEAWTKALADGDDQLRLEAFWTYQTVGNTFVPELLKRLLKSAEPRIRAAAVRATSYNRARLPDAQDLLAAAASDENARVRLEAVRALSAYSNTKSIEGAAQVVSKPMDKFLTYALNLMIDETKSGWLDALESGALTFGGNARAFEYVLKAVRSPKGVKNIVEQLKAGKTPPESYDSALDIIAEVGSADDIGVLLDLAVNTATPPVARAKLLPAIRKAAQPGRKVVPAGDVKRIAPLFDHADERVRAEAIAIAGAWQKEEFRAKFVEVATADATPSAIRQAAFGALADTGGAPSVDTLKQLAGADKKPAMRLGAIAALVRIDGKAAVPLAVQALSGDLAGADPTPLFAALLQRNAADAFAAEIAKGKMPADTAVLGIRAAQAASQFDTPFVKALAKAGGIPAEPAELTKDDVQKLVAEVAAKGDPARGEALFRRTDTSCMRCHSIGGAGGNVGPDLVSIGASAPVDYLVESLYFPNKAVKEGYHALVVNTKDGKVVTGIKVREEGGAIVLRDSNAEETTIAAANIGKQRNAGSIMPAGLMDPLTRQESLDLIRFLSELGKPGPFAASGVPVARRWQVLKSINAGATKGEDLAAQAAAQPDGDWTTTFSRVSGDLQLAEAPKNPASLSVVRTQVEVSTGGAFKLKLAPTAGVLLTIDGAPAAAQGETAIDLKPGIRTLLFVVDRTKVGETFRVELGEVPGSAAKAQFLTRK